MPDDPLQQPRRVYLLEAGVVLLSCGGMLALALFAERGFNEQAASRARRESYRSATFKMVAQMLGHEPEDPPAPELTTTDMVLNFLWGMTLAAPPVLLVQWLIRGRRQRLGWAEWLWLFQCALVVLLVAVPHGGRWLGEVGDWFIFIPLGCLVAAICFLARSFTHPSRLSYLWTERLAATVCCVAAYLTAYYLMQWFGVL